MKFIQDRFTSMLEVKKSKFYASLFPLQSLEDVTLYIQECKKAYPEARHHRYAYIFLEEREGFLQEQKKQSDDGEPAKTAGAPILQRLERKELKNVLCVVSRIFGGTLLGTGGLSRAYGDAAEQVLSEAQLLERKEGKEIRLSIPYTLLGRLEYDFQEMGIRILEKDYTDRVELLLQMEEEQYLSLEKHIGEYGQEVVFLAIKNSRWYTS